MFSKTTFLTIIFSVALSIGATNAQTKSSSIDQLYDTYADLQSQLLLATDPTTQESLKKKISLTLCQIRKQSAQTSTHQAPYTTRKEPLKETRRQESTKVQKDWKLYYCVAQAYQIYTGIMTALFSPNFLDRNEKNTLTKLNKSWKKMYNRALDSIESKKALKLASVHVAQLSQFTATLLEAYFKTELLTIDLNDTHDACVETSYNKKKQQQVMLALWQKLTQTAKKYPSIHEGNIPFDTTTEIRNLLPSSIIGSALSRRFPLTDNHYRAKKLYQLLDINFVKISKPIALAYLSFMRSYNSLQSSSITDQKKQADTLLSLLEAKSLRVGPEAYMLINLFSAKILSIKQDLAIKEKVEELRKNAPGKVDLFIKYTSLITSKKINMLIDQLTPICDYGYACYGHDEEKEQELEELFITYRHVVEKYFHKSEYDSQLSLEAGSLKHQLIDIKKDYVRSYLLLGMVGSHKVAKELQICIDIITSVELDIKKSLGSSQGSSGIWQLLKESPAVLQQKISSIQGLTSLVQASPLLGIGLLKFVEPHISSNLKNRILAFLGTKPEKKVAKDELLDFLKNNTQIAQALINQSPEFSQMLIEKFKNKQ